MDLCFMMGAPHPMMICCPVFAAAQAVWHRNASAENRNGKGSEPNASLFIQKYIAKLQDKPQRITTLRLGRYVTGSGTPVPGASFPVKAALPFCSRAARRYRLPFFFDSTKALYTSSPCISASRSFSVKNIRSARVCRLTKSSVMLPCPSRIFWRSRDRCRARNA